MSYKLLIFTWPLDANATLQLDSGVVLNGKPDTHHTGRLGISFSIPEETPQGNGCTLTLQAGKKVNITQRAILWLNDGLLDYPWDKNQEAAFAADDFQMQDEKVCPEIPIPPIPPKPPNNNDPLSIILSVYTSHLFDLSTKKGCGMFTEACCDALHTVHSNLWGHIKKIPPQNHYPEEPYIPGSNVHAVDAIQLLVKVNETIGGIYDIILDSESQNAKPAFNYKGNPEPLLWYYPA